MVAAVVWLREHDQTWKFGTRLVSPGRLVPVPSARNDTALRLLVSRARMSSELALLALPL
jgi:hypothetical protein